MRPTLPTVVPVFQQYLSSRYLPTFKTCGHKSEKVADKKLILPSICLSQCLTMSKKNLEHLEGLEKKELTNEKVAGVIVDGIMRHYDTNLHKFDVLAIKSSLLMFTYTVCMPKSSIELLKGSLDLLAKGLKDLPGFVRNLQEMKSTTNKLSAKSKKVSK